MAIKYIQPVKGAAGKGLAVEVLAQLRREFGAEVEPIAVHTPIPELLAAVWGACRETLLVGNVRRDVKEAVATTVSVINRCPYCIDAHSIMLSAFSEDNVAEAVHRQRYSHIQDPFMRSVVQWAAVTQSPGAGLLHSPPFTPSESPELIGTAVFFHYINRLVSVLLTETPLPANIPWLKKGFIRMAGLFFSRAIKRQKKEGESLVFLPEADLPDDLIWAKPAPHIAGAFARLARETGHAGEASLSAEVRAFVLEMVNEWNGGPPGISRQWTERHLSKLDEAGKRAGRLSLLTALSPYQVDETIIQEFREYSPGDRTLLGALAWSSFTAAKRIGTWLHAGTLNHKAG